MKPLAVLCLFGVAASATVAVESYERGHAARPGPAAPVLPEAPRAAPPRQSAPPANPWPWDAAGFVRAEVDFGGGLVVTLPRVPPGTPCACGDRVVWPSGRWSAVAHTLDYGPMPGGGSGCLYLGEESRRTLVAGTLVNYSVFRLMLCGEKARTVWESPPVFMPPGSRPASVTLEKLGTVAPDGERFSRPDAIAVRLYYAP